MVVGVEVVLVRVVLNVDVVLIHVLAHVDLGEDVLKLWVVMERNGREWVEVVGVDLSGLGHQVILLLINLLLLIGAVGSVAKEVASNRDRVD
jgi:hypothetical protein